MWSLWVWSLIVLFIAQQMTKDFRPDMSDREYKFDDVQGVRTFFHSFLYNYFRLTRLRQRYKKWLSFLETRAGSRNWEQSYPPVRERVCVLYKMVYMCMYM